MFLCYTDEKHIKFGAAYILYSILYTYFDNLYCVVSRVWHATQYANIDRLQDPDKMRNVIVVK